MLYVLYNKDLEAKDHSLHRLSCDSKNRTNEDIFISQFKSFTARFFTKKQGWRLKQNLLVFFAPFIY